MSVTDPLLNESNAALEQGYGEHFSGNDVKSEFLVHFPVATAENPELVIFDTDIGDFSDDAFALLLALNSPEISILGITTVYGNVLQRAVIAQQITTLAGLARIPVLAGESTPIKTSPKFETPVSCRQWNPLLEENIQNVKGGAVDFIIKTCSENPGKVTIFSIGPMTNIAAALKKRPQLETELKRIVVMGGTFFKAYPEYNLEVDAAATTLLLAADVPKWAVGLDVTLQCRHPVAHLEALRQHTSPAQKFVSSLLQPDKLDHAHDPLALAAMIRADFITFVRGNAIQTDPGVIIFTPLPPSNPSSSTAVNRNVIFAANSVQSQPFLDFFKERVFS